MRTLTNGQHLVTVPGSNTGTHPVEGLRPEYRGQDYRSLDATMFLPAGSTTLGTGGIGFLYSLDPLTLRPGNW